MLDDKRPGPLSRCYAWLPYVVLVSEFLNIYLLAKKVGSVGFERFLRVWSLVSSCVEFGALRA